MCVSIKRIYQTSRRRTLPAVAVAPGAGRYRGGIGVVKAQRILTDGIITHRFSLDEYPQALAAVESDRSAHKVVIHP